MQRWCVVGIGSDKNRNLYNAPDSDYSSSDSLACIWNHPNLILMWLHLSGAYRSTPKVHTVQITTKAVKDSNIDMIFSRRGNAGKGHLLLSFLYSPLSRRVCPDGELYLDSYARV